MTNPTQTGAGTGSSLASAAGIGSVLTFAVKWFWPEKVNEFSAIIPIISSSLAYIITVLWNRYGLESPEMADIRSKLESDKKNCLKSLNDQNVSDETKKLIQAEYDKTCLMLSSLGKNYTVSTEVDSSRTQSKSD